MKRRNGHNKIAGGFVAIPYEMMDHPAFRELSEAAMRVLLWCIRKTNRQDVDRHNVVFQLSYPEAKNKLRMVDTTFRRAMIQLHKAGFIDYYSPGGLRKDGKAAKGYKLSRRWKNWGQDSFEERRETYFEAIHG